MDFTINELVVICNRTERTLEIVNGGKTISLCVEKHRSLRRATSPYIDPTLCKCPLKHVHRLGESEDMKTT